MKDDYKTDFKFVVVVVAYDLWRITKDYKPKDRPGPPTLEEWLSRQHDGIELGIIDNFRRGAKIFVENPRFAHKKAIGQKILADLENANAAELVKKFRAKAEREWKALFKKCPAKPLSAMEILRA